MNTTDQIIDGNDFSTKVETDNSVREARWMFAAVGFLAFGVFALGMIAEMIIA